MNYPPPQPQPPLQPLKKKGTGCLIFLAIGGALLVLGGIVIMVVAWKFMSSPAGQAAKAGIDGMNAPGAAELRSIGCAQSSIVDGAKIQAFTAQLVEASADAAPRDYGLMVMCISNGRSGTPTCQQVSETYQKAVTKPAAPYLVMVKVQGETSPDCTMIYGTDGIRIRGTE